MKRVLAVTLTVVMVGGLISYAAAHQERGGRGGRWGRGDCGDGPQSCQQDSQYRGGEKFRGEERGEWRGRGFGPGRCQSERSVEGVEGVEGDVDTSEEATAVVGSFLEFRGNPNLKVGKVTETGRDYEVEIVTKDGSLANKVYVEKQTGRIIPAYR